MCSNQHTDTDKLGQPSNWKCKNRNKLGNQKSRFPLEKKNAINAGTKMAVDPKTYIYIILFSFSFFQQTSALKLWNRYSFDWEIFLLLIFVSHALHAFTLQHFFLCEGWINLFFCNICKSRFLQRDCRWKEYLPSIKSSTLKSDKISVKQDLLFPLIWSTRPRALLLSSSSSI